MTTDPADPAGPDGSAPPKYADRCYRSSGAIAGGVLLLALAAWLGTDAIVNGSGRVPWATAAALVFALPLVVAYTFRPAVFAGDGRIRVRNPFRTVSVPWTSVDGFRAGYSNELVVDGSKYQLWALPVSLRARKGAARHNARVRAGAASGRPVRPGGLLGFGGHGGPDVDATERRAPSDRAIDELRELAERHSSEARGRTAEPAAAAVSVRWAYEILAPAAAGALALALVIGLG